MVSGDGCRDHPDPRRVDGRGDLAGRHRGARSRRRRRPRPHGRTGEPGRADLPPARAAAEAVRARAAGAQGRALHTVGVRRRDGPRLRHRCRRRHRRALHVRLEGQARTAERAGRRRRPRRAAVEGRVFPRAARVHATAGRRRPDQRVQLPGVGRAREARARVPGWRADDRQAGHPHGVSGRGVGAHSRRVRPRARRHAAAGERPRARPVRAARPRRPRGVHRQRRHRPASARAGTARRALHERDRLDQRLGTGSGCRGRHPGVRRVRAAALRRADDESRPEVHRDPPGDRSGRRRRCRRRRPGRDDRGAHRARRPARRGRHDGTAGVAGAAR